jgi:hypothetical protein
MPFSVPDWDKDGDASLEILAREIGIVETRKRQTKSRE